LSPTDAPGVVALDRLAEGLLAASAPLRVEAVRTAAELEAVQRLRYEHVIAKGWVQAEELPAGLEADQYDERAVQIAAWEGTALVGTGRVVLPRPGSRLPVEDAFDLEVEPRDRVVEIGRVLIAEGRRGDPAHAAWGALFARAWVEVRERGFVIMAGSASAGLVARYRELGLPFEILGPARTYWGEERHPVRLDPAAARPRWYQQAEGD
jgi:hypothetical protein